jgi:hypothetical protein
MKSSTKIPAVVKSLTRIGRLLSPHLVGLAELIRTRVIRNELYKFQVYSVNEYVKKYNKGPRPFDDAQGRESLDFARDRELVERLIERVLGFKGSRGNYLVISG